MFITGTASAETQPKTAETPAPQRAQGEMTHRVVEGDSIWKVAVANGICGPNDDVDTCWVPLYEQNRGIVGANPDLILPGQTLHFVGGLVLPAPPVAVSDAGEPVVPAKQASAAEKAAPEVKLHSAVITNSAGPVHARTQHAADMIFTHIPGASLITMGGTRSSAVDMHGHPSGNAIDYMVMGDGALGDAIVSYQIAHWDELGVDYIIYRQRILQDPGGSWRKMEDRGSPTQNHMDHVHTNYNP